MYLQTRREDNKYVYYGKFETIEESQGFRRELQKEGKKLMLSLIISDRDFATLTRGDWDFEVKYVAGKKCEHNIISNACNLCNP